MEENTNAIRSAQELAGHLFSVSDYSMRLIHLLQKNPTLAEVECVARNLQMIVQSASENESVFILLSELSAAFCRLGAPLPHWLGNFAVEVLTRRLAPPKHQGSP